MEVASFVISEVLVSVATQKLKPEQAFIRFLLATIKEFLGAISRVKWFLVFAHNPEAILQCCIFNLL